MAYTVDRAGIPPVRKMPIAVRLIADWKRSLSARARLLKLSGPVGDRELQYMAGLWLALHDEDLYLRRREDLPNPGDVPEWVHERFKS